MTEGMKHLLPIAMLAWGSEKSRDEWQDILEDHMPYMILHDFDEVWTRYEELKARRMAA